MTDAHYRKVCHALRDATRYFHVGMGFTQKEADRKFLNYCEYHVTNDGPGAMFTGDQLDRLERMSGAKMDRGLRVGGTDYVPSVEAVLAAVQGARNAVLEK